MDSQPEQEFKPLAGKTPQEVVCYLRERGYNVTIKYTYDKKSLPETEERVIRIKKANEGLEVLVGLFQLPSYRQHFNGNPL